MKLVEGGVPIKFLSTPSARRATDPDKDPPKVETISIHALREEGDVAAVQSDIQVQEFLSTPSTRRAT